MARAPMAVWNRCPGSEPAIRPTQFIFHTAVMRDLSDLQDYFCFGRSGGIESHFGVGGKWGRSLAQDGEARQWRDTQEQADANLRANRRPDGTGAISVETCDNAPRFARDIEEWTPKQAAKLVALGRWARATHGIPARICRTPDDPGFGWHAMWDNTRFELPDGSTPWTPSAGKECPGPRRIAQLKRDILPAIFADEEDDFMALFNTVEEFRAAVADAVFESDRGRARIQELIVDGVAEVVGDMVGGITDEDYRRSARGETSAGGYKQGFHVDSRRRLAILIEGLYTNAGLTVPEVPLELPDEVGTRAVAPPSP